MEIKCVIPKQKGMDEGKELHPPASHQAETGLIAFLRDRSAKIVILRTRVIRLCHLPERHGRRYRHWCERLISPFQAADAGRSYR